MNDVKRPDRRPQQVRSVTSKWAIVRYAIAGGWGRTFRLALILIVMQLPAETILWHLWHWRL
jgi:hypothetical protein